MHKDLYEILGVSRSAGEEEIRKAYKNLARKYHPDLNQNDKDAEERFKEVAVAYEVLHDQNKRKNYDEFGEDALNPNFDPERAREFARFRQRGGQGFAGGPAGSPFGGSVDFGDLFSELFGGGRGRTKNPWGRARRVKGSDMESSMRISFLDAIRGTKINFTLSGGETCEACGGIGRKQEENRPCPTCNGTGQQTMTAPLNMNAACRTCGGSGRASGPPCPSCGGKGAVNSSSIVTVTVPPGIKDGAKIRLAGKGEPGLGGGPSGDLYLKVEVIPHSYLERDGDNLIMTLPVTVPEAVRGAIVTIPLIEGEAKVKVPPRSQTGQKLRLRSKGAPKGRNKGAGDLILELEVRAPTSKSEELDQKIAELEEFYEEDIRAELKL